MLGRVLETWNRDAIGFRQGELEDGDGMAATVVTVIGAPAMLVGAALASSDALSIGQVLLVAPVAALLGGVLVGSSAGMAARTGANGAALMRPTYGKVGASLVSLVRLLMVVLWGALALRLAGNWLGVAVSSNGLAVSPSAWIAVVAAGGFLLLLAGLVPVIRRLYRTPLFLLSVALAGLLVWRLASTTGGIDAGADGSFWSGVQRAVEAAIIFVPFLESVARRLNNDEAAVPTFGVAYAVPATLMFAAGAVLILTFGDLGSLGDLGAGTLGAFAAVAWVLVAEIDQAFSAFVAGGAEAVTMTAIVPRLVAGLVSVAAMVAVAFIGDIVADEWAFLAAAVVFPATLIANVDFQLVNDRRYAEDDLYGPSGRRLNLAGILCWLAAVVIGQLLEPIGPEAWTRLVGGGRFDVEVPWRLVVAVVAGVAYALIMRWNVRRTAEVYAVRGVSTYEVGR